MSQTPRREELREEWIDELNRLMAEELEAFLRYFQLRYRVRGDEAREVAKSIDEALRETLEHAGEIAARIRDLGATPRLKIGLDLDGGPIPLQEALSEALEFEQQALDAYRDFLPRVSGHKALADFIGRQVEVETEHVKQLTSLLDQAIEKGGAATS